MTPKFNLNDFVVITPAYVQDFRNKIGIIVVPKNDIHNGSYFYDRLGDIFYSVNIDSYHYWIKENILDHVKLTEIEKLITCIKSKHEI